MQAHTLCGIIVLKLSIKYIGCHNDLFIYLRVGFHYEGGRLRQKICCVYS
jgi:hypothetical protein